MESHSDHWMTYLSRTYRIRGDIHSQITFLFASCSLNPKPEPFFTIRSSSDHPRFRTRPKAQYIIWALNPTNIIIIQITHSKFSYFYFGIRFLKKKNCPYLRLFQYHQFVPFC